MPRKAWRYAEVEYANAGSSYGALALDCDDADAYARGFLRSEIPPPNWRVFRPDTGHSQDAGRAGARVVSVLRGQRGRCVQGRPASVRAACVSCADTALQPTQHLP